MRTLQIAPRLQLILAFFLCALPGTAASVSIDFESGVYSSVGTGVGNVYQEDGFTFRTLGTTGATFHFDSSPQFQATEPDPQTVPYLAWHNGGSNGGLNPVELHFGGSPFSLTSLFLVALLDPPPPMTITASSGSMLMVLGQSETLNFGPGFQGITWVRFDLDPSPAFDDVERAVDNVVVQSAAVPAPAALPLLSLGLLALLGFRARPRVTRGQAPV